MSGKRWTLSTRLTRWMLVGSIAPVIFVTIGGGSYFAASVRSELRELTREELNEAVWALRDVPDVGSGFLAIHRELASHHPAYRMARR